jgi:(1->4)-alpha-D-glucan 1-alpha-D-glucosylmutase
MREARVTTNWIAPNTDYENAVSDFIADALNPTKAHVFLESFLPFHERVALLGMRNGVVQTVLKLTCPGVPDFYQGSELWDLSMLDPDNRRPVDYGVRRQLLRKVKVELANGREDAIRALSKNWQDGAIKMAIIHTLLQFRASNPELFAGPSYQSIDVNSEHAEKICAFTRRLKNQQLVVVALTDVRIEGTALQKSLLLLQDSSISKWQDILTGKSFSITLGALPVSEILSELPAAVLVAPTS